MAEYDPIDQDAQKQKRKAAKTRADNEQRRDDDNLRWLMSTPRGRRIVWHLLDKAQVNAATFSTNALQMAYNEGFRGYGTWMLGRILDVCPERYLELLKEHEDDERDTSGSGQNFK